MSKVKAEFEQLRTEGVMFFYKGEPVCFWRRLAHHHHHRDFFGASSKSRENSEH